MYNTKFLLPDGKEVYLGYLDKESRLKLRDKYKDSNGILKCGCKPSKNLYYKISEDLKIYPAHNNYFHDRFCCRYTDKNGKKVRQTGYVVNEEGGVTAYLAFNPRTFTNSEDVETEEIIPDVTDEEPDPNEKEAILKKDGGITNKSEKKEPKLSLAALIRNINIDTYSESILNGRIIDSKDSFSKCVYHRMKLVNISRMNKPIGELNLESDGVRFIYTRYAGTERKEVNGLTRSYVKIIVGNGKIINVFIYPETLDKAIIKFVKKYGIEPNEDTMLAGFQYHKKNKAGRMYRVLGRIHLFQVSDSGLYCRSLVEKETFNTISNIIQQDKNITFWIPPEDESIGGFIKVNNKSQKILVLFRSKKDERILFDSSNYQPLVVGTNEPLTKNSLYQFIEEKLK